MSYPLFAAEWHLTETSTEAIFAVFPIVAANRLPSRLAMVLGCFASTVAVALLVLAVREHTFALFLAATTMAGVGYGLLFSRSAYLNERKCPS
jgi:Na+/melibiose symporter-like transporter